MTRSQLYAITQFFNISHIGLYTPLWSQAELFYCLLIVTVVMTLRRHNWSDCTQSSTITGISAKNVQELGYTHGLVTVSITLRCLRCQKHCGLMQRYS